MNLFERLGNGWTITKSSFSILKKNKQLLIFPVLSGIAIVLIVASIVVALLASKDWQAENLSFQNDSTNYIFVFLFYLVNYFVVVFFNVALIHCTKLYLEGNQPTVSAGLKYSLTRIGAIFSWAMFAATVGTILRIIEENAGWLGKIIAGLLGIVWGVATFFVVPIVAYENLGPIDAFKRSGSLMKQKWGESLSATFSMGLIQFIALLLIAAICVPIAMYIDPFIGIGLGVILACVLFAMISAAQTIFTGLVYMNVTGSVEEHFNQQLIDGLFEKKASKWG